MTGTLMTSDSHDQDSHDAGLSYLLSGGKTVGSIMDSIKHRL